MSSSYHHLSSQHCTPPHHASNYHEIGDLRFLRADYLTTLRASPRKTDMLPGQPQHGQTRNRIEMPFTYPSSSASNHHQQVPPTNSQLPSPHLTTSTQSQGQGRSTSHQQDQYDTAVLASINQALECEKSSPWSDPARPIAVADQTRDQSIGFHSTQPQDLLKDINTEFTELCKLLNLAPTDSDISSLPLQLHAGLLSEQNQLVPSSANGHDDDLQSCSIGSSAVPRSTDALFVSPPDYHKSATTLSYAFADSMTKSLAGKHTNLQYSCIFDMISSTFSTTSPPLNSTQIPHLLPTPLPIGVSSLCCAHVNNTSQHNSQAYSAMDGCLSPPLYTDQGVPHALGQRSTNTSPYTASLAADTLANSHPSALLSYYQLPGQATAMAHPQKPGGGPNSLADVLTEFHKDLISSGTSSLPQTRHPHQSQSMPFSLYATLSNHVKSSLGCHDASRTAPSLHQALFSFDNWHREAHGASNNPSSATTSLARLIADGLNLATDLDVPLLFEHIDTLSDSSTPHISNDPQLAACLNNISGKQLHLGELARNNSTTSSLMRITLNSLQKLSHVKIQLKSELFDPAHSCLGAEARREVCDSLFQCASVLELYLTILVVIRQWSSLPEALFLPPAQDLLSSPSQLPVSPCGSSASGKLDPCVKPEHHHPVQSPDQTQADGPSQPIDPLLPSSCSSMVSQHSSTPNEARSSMVSHSMRFQISPSLIPDEEDGPPMDLFSLNGENSIPHTLIENVNSNRLTQITEGRLRLHRDESPTLSAIKIEQPMQPPHQAPRLPIPATPPHSIPPHKVDHSSLQIPRVTPAQVYTSHILLLAICFAPIAELAAEVTQLLAFAIHKSLCHDLEDGSQAAIMPYSWHLPFQIASMSLRTSIDILHHAYNIVLQPALDIQSLLPQQPSDHDSLLPHQRMLAAVLNNAAKPLLLLPIHMQTIFPHVLHTHDTAHVAISTKHPTLLDYIDSFYHLYMQSLLSLPPLPAHIMRYMSPISLAQEAVPSISNNTTITALFLMLAVDIQHHTQHFHIVQMLKSLLPLAADPVDHDATTAPPPRGVEGYVQLLLSLLAVESFPDKLSCPEYSTTRGTFDVDLVCLYLRVPQQLSNDHSHLVDVISSFVEAKSAPHTPDSHLPMGEQQRGANNPSTNANLDELLASTLLKNLSQHNTLAIDFTRYQQASTRLLSQITSSSNIHAPFSSKVKIESPMISLGHLARLVAYSHHLTIQSSTFIHHHLATPTSFASKGSARLATFNYFECHKAIAANNSTLHSLWSIQSFLAKAITKPPWLWDSKVISDTSESPPSHIGLIRWLSRMVFPHLSTSSYWLSPQSSPQPTDDMDRDALSPYALFIKSSRQSIAHPQNEATNLVKQLLTSFPSQFRVFLSRITELLHTMRDSRSQPEEALPRSIHYEELSCPTQTSNISSTPPSQASFSAKPSDQEQDFAVIEDFINTLLHDDAPSSPIHRSMNVKYTTLHTVAKTLVDHVRHYPRFFRVQPILVSLSLCVTGLHSIVPALLHRSQHDLIGKMIKSPTHSHQTAICTFIARMSLMYTSVEYRELATGMVTMLMAEAHSSYGVSLHHESDGPHQIESMILDAYRCVMRDPLCRTNPQNIAALLSPTAAATQAMVHQLPDSNNTAPLPVLSTLVNLFYPALGQTDGNISCPASSSPRPVDTKAFPQLFSDTLFALLPNTASTPSHGGGDLISQIYLATYPAFSSSLSSLPFQQWFSQDRHPMATSFPLELLLHLLNAYSTFCYLSDALDDVNPRTKSKSTRCPSSSELQRWEHHCLTGSASAYQRWIRCSLFIQLISKKEPDKMADAAAPRSFVCIDFNSELSSDGDLTLAANRLQYHQNTQPPQRHEVLLSNPSAHTPATTSRPDRLSLTGGSQRGLPTSSSPLLEVPGSSLHLSHLTPHRPSQLTLGDDFHQFSHAVHADLFSRVVVDPNHSSGLTRDSNDDFDILDDLTFTDHPEPSGSASLVETIPSHHHHSTNTLNSQHSSHPQPVASPSLYDIPKQYDFSTPTSSFGMVPPVSLLEQINGLSQHMLFPSKKSESPDTTHLRMVSSRLLAFIERFLTSCRHISSYECAFPISSHTPPPSTYWLGATFQADCDMDDFTAESADMSHHSTPSATELDRDIILATYHNLPTSFLGSSLTSITPPECEERIQRQPCAHSTTTDVYLYTLLSYHLLGLPVTAPPTGVLLPQSNDTSDVDAVVCQGSSHGMPWSKVLNVFKMNIILHSVQSLNTAMSRDIDTLPETVPAWACSQVASYSQNFIAIYATVMVCQIVSLSYFPVMAPHNGQHGDAIDSGKLDINLPLPETTFGRESIGPIEAVNQHHSYLALTSVVSARQSLLSRYLHHLQQAIDQLSCHASRYIHHLLTDLHLHKANIPLQSPLTVPTHLVFSLFDTHMTTIFANAHNNPACMSLCRHPASQSSEPLQELSASPRQLPRPYRRSAAYPRTVAAVSLFLMHQTSINNYLSQLYNLLPAMPLAINPDIHHFTDTYHSFISDDTLLPLKDATSSHERVISRINSLLSGPQGCGSLDQGCFEIASQMLGEILAVSPTIASSISPNDLPSGIFDRLESGGHVDRNHRQLPGHNHHHHHGLSSSHTSTFRVVTTSLVLRTLLALIDGPSLAIPCVDNILVSPDMKRFFLDIPNDSETPSTPWMNVVSRFPLICPHHLIGVELKAAPSTIPPHQNGMHDDTAGIANPNTSRQRQHLPNRSPPTLHNHLSSTISSLSQYDSLPALQPVDQPSVGQHHQQRELDHSTLSDAGIVGDFISKQNGFVSIAKTHIVPFSDYLNSISACLPNVPVISRHPQRTSANNDSNDMNSSLQTPLHWVNGFTHSMTISPALSSSQYCAPVVDALLSRIRCLLPDAIYQSITRLELQHPLTTTLAEFTTTLRTMLHGTMSLFRVRSLQQRVLYRSILLTSTMLPTLIRNYLLTQDQPQPSREHGPSSSQTRLVSSNAARREYVNLWHIIDTYEFFPDITGSVLYHNIDALTGFVIATLSREPTSQQAPSADHRYQHQHHLMAAHNSTKRSGVVSMFGGPLSASSLSASSLSNTSRHHSSSSNSSISQTEREQFLADCFTKTFLQSMTYDVSDFLHNMQLIDKTTFLQPGPVLQHPRRRHYIRHVAQLSLDALTAILPYHMYFTKMIHEADPHVIFKLTTPCENRRHRNKSLSVSAIRRRIWQAPDLRDISANPSRTHMTLYPCFDIQLLRHADTPQAAGSGRDATRDLALPDNPEIGQFLKLLPGMAQAYVLHLTERVRSSQLQSSSAIPSVIAIDVEPPSETSSPQGNAHTGTPPRSDQTLFSLPLHGIDSIDTAATFKLLLVYRHIAPNLHTLQLSSSLLIALASASRQLAVPHCKPPPQVQASILMAAQQQFFNSALFITQLLRWSAPFTVYNVLGLLIDAQYTHYPPLSSPPLNDVIEINPHYEQGDILLSSFQSISLPNMKQIPVQTQHYKVTFPQQPGGDPRNNISLDSPDRRQPFHITYNPILTRILSPVGLLWVDPISVGPVAAVAAGLHGIATTTTTKKDSLCVIMKGQQSITALPTIVAPHASPIPVSSLLTHTQLLEMLSFPIHAMLLPDSMFFSASLSSINRPTGDIGSASTTLLSQLWTAAVHSPHFLPLFSHLGVCRMPRKRTPQTVSQLILSPDNIQILVNPFEIATSIPVNSIYFTGQYDQDARDPHTPLILHTLADHVHETIKQQIDRRKALRASIFTRFLSVISSEYCQHYCSLLSLGELLNAAASTNRSSHESQRNMPMSLRHLRPSRSTASDHVAGRHHPMGGVLDQYHPSLFDAHVYTVLEEFTLFIRPLFVAMLSSFSPSLVASPWVYLDYLQRTPLNDETTAVVGLSRKSRPAIYHFLTAYQSRVVKSWSNSTITTTSNRDHEDPTSNITSDVLPAAAYLRPANTPNNSEQLKRTSPWHETLAYPILVQTTILESEMYHQLANDLCLTQNPIDYLPLLLSQNASPNQSEPERTEADISTRSRQFYTLLVMVTPIVLPLLSIHSKYRQTLSMFELYSYRLRPSAVIHSPLYTLFLFLRPMDPISHITHLLAQQGYAEQQPSGDMSSNQHVAPSSHTRQAMGMQTQPGNRFSSTPFSPGATAFQTHRRPRGTHSSLAYPRAPPPVSGQHHPSTSSATPSLASIYHKCVSAAENDLESLYSSFSQHVLMVPANRFSHALENHSVDVNALEISLADISSLYPDIHLAFLSDITTEYLPLVSSFCLQTFLFETASLLHFGDHISAMHSRPDAGSPRSHLTLLPPSYWASTEQQFFQNAYNGSSKLLYPVVYTGPLDSAPQHSSLVSFWTRGRQKGVLSNTTRLNPTQLNITSFASLMQSYEHITKLMLAGQRHFDRFIKYISDPLPQATQTASVETVIRGNIHGRTTEQRVRTSFRQIVDDLHFQYSQSSYNQLYTGHITQLLVCMELLKYTVNDPLLKVHHYQWQFPTKKVGGETPTGAVPPLLLTEDDHENDYFAHPVLQLFTSAIGAHGQEMEDGIPVPGAPQDLLMSSPLYFLSLHFGTGAPHSTHTGVARNNDDKIISTIQRSLIAINSSHVTQSSLNGRMNPTPFVFCSSLGGGGATPLPGSRTASGTDHNPSEGDAPNPLSQPYPSRQQLLQNLSTVLIVVPDSMASRLPQQKRLHLLSDMLSLLFPVPTKARVELPMGIKELYTPPSLVQAYRTSVMESSHEMGANNGTNNTNSRELFPIIMRTLIYNELQRAKHTPVLQQSRIPVADDLQKQQQQTRLYYLCTVLPGLIIQSLHSIVSYHPSWAESPLQSSSSSSRRSKGSQQRIVPMLCQDIVPLRLAILLLELHIPLYKLYRVHISRLSDVSNTQGGRPHAERHMGVRRRIPSVIGSVSPSELITIAQSLFVPTILLLSVNTSPLHDPRAKPSELKASHAAPLPQNTTPSEPRAPVHYYYAAIHLKALLFTLYSTFIRVFSLTCLFKPFHGAPALISPSTYISPPPPSSSSSSSSSTTQSLSQPDLSALTPDNPQLDQHPHQNPSRQRFKPKGFDAETLYQQLLKQSSQLHPQDQHGVSKQTHDKDLVLENMSSPQQPPVQHQSAFNPGATIFKDSQIRVDRVGTILHHLGLGDIASAHSSMFHMQQLRQYCSSISHQLVQLTSQQSSEAIPTTAAITHTATITVELLPLPCLYALILIALEEVGGDFDYPNLSSTVLGPIAGRFVRDNLMNPSKQTATVPDVLKPTENVTFTPQAMRVIGKGRTLFSNQLLHGIINDSIAQVDRLMDLNSQLVAPHLSHATTMTSAMLDIVPYGDDSINSDGLQNAHLIGWSEYRLSHPDGQLYNKLGHHHLFNCQHNMLACQNIIFTQRTHDLASGSNPAAAGESYLSAPSSIHRSLLSPLESTMVSSRQRPLPLMVCDASCVRARHVYTTQQQLQPNPNSNTNGMNKHLDEDDIIQQMLDHPLNLAFSTRYVPWKPYNRTDPAPIYSSTSESLSRASKHSNADIITSPRSYVWCNGSQWLPCPSNAHGLPNHDTMLRNSSAAATGEGHLDLIAAPLFQQTHNYINNPVYWNHIIHTIAPNSTELLCRPGEHQVDQRNHENPGHPGSSHSFTASPSPLADPKPTVVIQNPLVFNQLAIYSSLLEPPFRTAQPQSRSPTTTIACGADTLQSQQPSLSMFQFILSMYHLRQIMYRCLARQYSHFDGQASMDAQAPIAHHLTLEDLLLAEKQYLNPTTTPLLFKTYQNCTEGRSSLSQDTLYSRFYTKTQNDLLSACQQVLFGSTNYATAHVTLGMAIQPADTSQDECDPQSSSSSSTIGPLAISIDSPLTVVPESISYQQTPVLHHFYQFITTSLVKLRDNLTALFKQNRVTQGVEKYRKRLNTLTVMVNKLQKDLSILNRVHHVTYHNDGDMLNQWLHHFSTIHRPILHASQQLIQQAGMSNIMPVPPFTQPPPQLSASSDSFMLNHGNVMWLVNHARQLYQHMIALSSSLDSLKQQMQDQAGRQSAINTVTSATMDATTHQFQQTHAAYLQCLVLLSMFSLRGTTWMYKYTPITIIMSENSGDVPPSEKSRCISVVSPFLDVYLLHTHRYTSQQQQMLTTQHHPGSQWLAASKDAVFNTALYMSQNGSPIPQLSQLASRLYSADLNRDDPSLPTAAGLSIIQVTQPRFAKSGILSPNHAAFLDKMYDQVAQSALFSHDEKTKD